MLIIQYFRDLNLYLYCINEELLSVEKYEKRFTTIYLSTLLIKNRA